MVLSSRKGGGFGGRDPIKPDKDATPKAHKHGKMSQRAVEIEQIVGVWAEYFNKDTRRVLIRKHAHKQSEVSWSNINRLLSIFQQILRFQRCERRWP